MSPLKSHSQPNATFRPSEGRLDSFSTTGYALCVTVFSHYHNSDPLPRPILIFRPQFSVSRLSVLLYVRNVYIRVFRKSIMSCRNCIHHADAPHEFVCDSVPSGDPTEIAIFAATHVDCYYFGDCIEMVSTTEAETCEEYTHTSEGTMRTMDEIRAKLVFLGKKRESAPNTRSRVYIRAIAQIKILRWLLGTELE